MSAAIFDMTTYRRLDDSVADRVADRLRGFAKPLVRYAVVLAESYQLKTGCNDSEAVSYAVRFAKSYAGETGDAA